MPLILGTPGLDHSPYVTFPSQPRASVRKSGKPRILIVDDEEAIRTPLSRFLSARGFETVTADSGRAALARLGEGPFEVMLSDIYMPEMTGLQLLPEAIRADRDLAVLMLTANSDAAAATNALSQGAMDYLLKPVELADLERAVVRALHRRKLEIERRNVDLSIRDEIASRTDELEREKRALHTLTLGVADSLIAAMEAKNVYLRGHAQRVAELAASVAEELGLSADVVENVRLAGRLHDVGKIGIRETILDKPGPLTAEQFDHVKDHVRIGMEILAPLKHMPEVLEYVQDHHEHYGGSGYPRGISGERIAIGGRILAACDAYDALTSLRAFRDAMDSAATLARLEESVGELLDPNIYHALKRVVLRRKSLTFLD